VKLHLGCGNRFIPGFFHVDYMDYPHVDRRGPVEDLTFLEDDTVELIYASHILEHFGRHEVERVLREWRRVLVPGGILRLAVPDFRAVVELYENEGLQNGYSGLVGLVCGGQRHPLDFHKIIFDKPFLTYLLRNAGYSDVRDWDWRTTEHATVDDYSQAYIPHMAKGTGRLVSLNVEAVR
jgi:predicted SAM-dependent methyltransferase